MEAIKLAATGTDVTEIMSALGREARAASRILALSADSQRTGALRIAAAAVRRRTGDVLAANRDDVAASAARGTTAAFADRLVLDAGRVEAIAEGLDEIAAPPGFDAM